MDLSVVIVNYNVKYFLEQVLLSVRNASKNLDIEVFVVDNNSVDDSVAMVKQKFKEVILIDNKDNVGFSKANNQAIRLAKAPYVLLLNPDTVVEEDTFNKCFDFMESNPQVGGLGVKMIDGSGKFLPESKRGFPDPFVAFCKTFGLSALFPKSKVFNRYYLGYLDDQKNHEVEVLAGAFMWLRKSVLDKVGLLDEAFFMYGEDIDLSYRIVLGGYKNYYLADTRIIHYKGESTKKGSLNYVKVFYNAMIIFAKKHFQGNQARIFVLMLRLAIYFRASITLASRFFRKMLFPFLDVVAIFLGLIFLKKFWANYHFNDPDYYNTTFDYVNAPLYSLVWGLAIFFSGGYDEPYHLRRTIRGIILGVVGVAAIYGFLDLEYRSSRAIIILGFFWALSIIPLIRLVVHFLKYRNIRLERREPKKMIIVGMPEEAKRVKNLLQEAQVFKDIIGIVSPQKNNPSQGDIGNINQLNEIVQIYKVEEVVFCSKDISANDIINWMTLIGSHIEYKILPEESLSIIGSSSKDTSGELYTIDVNFKIDQTLQRRNKRMLDLIVAFFLLITYPIQAIIVKHPESLWKNIWNVLIGKYTWVGYTPNEKHSKTLPKLRPGILSPLDELRLQISKSNTLRQLNVLYAKNYKISLDLDIIFKGFRSLGRVTKAHKP